MKKPYDVIIYGSTGFTGRLAVSYLQNNYPNIKFAMAGRNADKMIEVQKELSLSKPVDTIIASSDDHESLKKMCSQTSCVLTYAGPYALYGSSLVQSCINEKCNYVDITGETPWVRKMIDQYDESAKKAGVKIVCCSGFDSIPSDLGCLFMVNKMKKKGLEPEEVKMIMGDSLGGASGGTIASAFNIVGSSSNAELMKLSNPFAICPRDNTTGEPQTPKSVAKTMMARDTRGPGFDPVYQIPTGPWIMQGVNTRVVNRSNALKNYSYGRDFIYTERMGLKSHFAAITTACIMPIISLLIFFPITRWLLKFIVPKPGQGPDEKTRENGFFKMHFWGRGNNQQGESKIIKGKIEAFNGDPGYKQTAKMSCETALCLVQDGDKIPNDSSSYGIVTPAVACDAVLIERLNQKGILFKDVDL